MEVALRRNIPISYIFSALQMALVFVPVLIVYQQSLGISISDCLLLQSIFCGAVALFEVPTGYIADMWSRKTSVCLGSFLSAVAFSSLLWVHDFEGFLAFELLIALACSLISGADISILYDSLTKEDDRLKILGNASLWSLLGETAASLLCALLIRDSFQAVIYAQIVVGWFAFGVSLLFTEPTIERMQKKNPFANMHMILKFLFFEDSFVRLVFINSVLWSLSSFCVVWLLQPYWMAQAVPLSYFGYLWAFLMFIAACSSKLVHTLEKKYGARNLFLVLAIAPCLAYFLMIASPGWIGLGAGILFYINRGFAAVLFQDALNWRLPAQFRSTANSLKSLFFRLGYFIIGPVIGAAVDWRGLDLGLLLLGVSFSLLFVMYMQPFIRRVEELKIDYVPETDPAN